MTSARFEYTDEDTGVVFRWHGGEYIDVYPYADAEYPTDCINVWDYATDEPTIARTLDAFERHCRDWRMDELA